MLRAKERCFALSADGKRELRRLIARAETLLTRARARGRCTRAEMQELRALLCEIHAWVEPKQMSLF